MLDSTICDKKSNCDKVKFISKSKLNSIFKFRQITEFNENIRDENFTFNSTLSKFKSVITTFNFLEISPKLKQKINKCKPDLEVYYADRFYIYSYCNSNLNTSSKDKNACSNVSNFVNLRSNNINTPFTIHSEISLEFISTYLIELRDNYEKKLCELSNEIDNKINEISLIESEYNKSINQKEDYINKINCGELHRKKLHDYIHCIKGNIRVYCRVKPTTIYNAVSLFRYPEMALNVSELYSLELKNPKSNEYSTYNFDKVFTPNSKQEEVI